MSTTYHCPEPYEHLEVVPSGDVHACCSGWVPRPVGNVLDQGILDIWRGAEMEEIRETVRSGSFSRCRECPFLPAPRGPVVVATGPAPLVPDRVSLLTLAYERSCGLSCPSCRTEVFRPDASHLEQARKISKTLTERGDLADVDRIVVTGSGDPFASRTYRELLRDLPWHLYPGLAVRIFTNLQLASRSGWEKLGDARDAVDQLSASVDAATAATYAANRRGGDFAVFLENLRLASAMRRGGAAGVRLDRLELTFTVQANNFRELPAFVELAESSGADVAYVARLRNWGTYTPWQYALRAVHAPAHQDHAELLRVLDDPRMKGAIVVAQNLGQ